MAITLPGRKPKAGAATTTDTVDWRLDPAVVAARVAVSKAELRVGALKRESEDCKARAGEMASAADRADALDGRRPALSTGRVRQAANDLQARAKGLARDLELAEQQLDRAQADLVAAERAAKASPIGPAAVLDWRISPLLIAATRALDEGQAQLADLQRQLAEAVAEADRKRAEAEDADGRHLAGRLSEFDRDRANDAAATARRTVVRLRFEVADAEQACDRLRGDLAAATRQAKTDAARALEATYISTMAEMADLLDRAAEVNARATELVRLARVTFPPFRAHADGAVGVRLPTGLLWSELDVTNPHARLPQWRKLLGSLGLHVAGGR